MKSSNAKYPIATVIAYGPDNKTATKMVVSVFAGPGDKEPVAMDKWLVPDGDIRQNPTIQDEVAAFLKQHGVKDTAVCDRILGCPHEEGIDYPLGGTCPHCPFWAEVDRFTHEPKSRFTPEQILAALSAEGSEQPVAELAAADQHRDALTPPFLACIERCLADPENPTGPDRLLFSFACAFLGKWREPHAYPLFIRWLSLPGEGAGDLGGDTVTAWGARLLASVCGPELKPIKALILNREANEFCRGQALLALAVLAAWGEVPEAEVKDYFLWLAREGLEREFSHVWNELACACVDTETLAVFPELRRAYEEGLIDAGCIAPDELDEVEQAPRGKFLARFRESHGPMTGIAKETAWWSGYYKYELDRHQAVTDTAVTGTEEFNLPGEKVIAEAAVPYHAPPKVGRNDPCPCGSGKKYKKCCGK